MYQFNLNYQFDKVDMCLQKSNFRFELISHYWNDLAPIVHFMGNPYDFFGYNFFSIFLSKKNVPSNTVKGTFRKISKKSPHFKEKFMKLQR